MAARSCVGHIVERLDVDACRNRGVVFCGHPIDLLPLPFLNRRLHRLLGRDFLRDVKARLRVVAQQPVSVSGVRHRQQSREKGRSDNGVGFLQDRFVADLET